MQDQDTLDHIAATGECLAELKELDEKLSLRKKEGWNNQDELAFSGKGIKEKDYSLRGVRAYDPKWREWRKFKKPDGTVFWALPR